MSTLHFYDTPVPVGATVDGKVVRLVINAETFTAEYPVPVAGMPRAHLDMLVWMVCYGLGINKKKKGHEVPYFVARPATIETPPMLCPGAILCYSAGADSTAALVLCPALPVLIYRSYRPQYHTSQMQCLPAVDGIRIITDFELIGQRVFGTPPGFRWAFGYAGMMMPLLHVWGYNTITLGEVWDQFAFVWTDRLVWGTRSRVLDEWAHACNIAASVGVRLALPAFGLSEVMTTRIADESGLPHTSCHTGEMKCGRCMKCLRREGHRGRQLAADAYAELDAKYLRQRPPDGARLEASFYPVLPSLAYGMQRAGYGHPRYDGLDLSFCERYSPDHVHMGMATADRYVCKPHDTADAYRIARYVDRINSPRSWA